MVQICEGRQDTIGIQQKLRHKKKKIIYSPASLHANFFER